MIALWSKKHTPQSSALKKRISAGESDARQWGKTKSVGTTWRFLERQLYLPDCSADCSADHWTGCFSWSRRCSQKHRGDWRQVWSCAKGTQGALDLAWQHWQLGQFWCSVQVFQWEHCDDCKICCMSCRRSSWSAFRRSQTPLGLSTDALQHRVEMVVLPTWTWRSVVLEKTTRIGEEMRRVPNELWPNLCFDLTQIFLICESVSPLNLCARAGRWKSLQRRCQGGLFNAPSGSVCKLTPCSSPRCLRPSAFVTCTSSLAASSELIALTESNWILYKICSPIESMLNKLGEYLINRCITASLHRWSLLNAQWQSPHTAKLSKSFTPTRWNWVWRLRASSRFYCRKTLAAMALLFAVQAFQQPPFMVLDEASMIHDIYRLGLLS